MTFLRSAEKLEIFDDVGGPAGDIVRELFETIGRYLCGGGS